MSYQMNDPAPGIGIRQLLRLKSIGPEPQYYFKRPSLRFHSQLLPKDQAKTVPFNVTGYGEGIVLVRANRRTSGKKDKNANTDGKKEKDGSNGKGDKGKAKTEANGAKAQQPNKGGKPTDDKAKGGAPNASGGWTTQQDADLSRAKQEGKTWAQISAALKKAQNDCKARWKEIKPKDDQSPNTGKNKDTNQTKKPNQDNKQKPKKQQTKDGDALTSVYEFAGDGRQHKRVDADDRFPPKVLRFAGRFDDDWYWTNMSSRLFDKYGVRYDPKELKVKMT